jgi:3-methylfumaryl-CoA hydratase
MSFIDIDYLRQWIGKEQSSWDSLSVRHVRLLAATLGLAQDKFDVGTPLPPLWHWIFFLEGLPETELGRDSHPARGGFLPPVPLSNRMWAGGNLSFHAPLPLEATMEKRSRILSVEHKQGRTGDLVFVTVLHEVLHNGALAVTETHDIVYKEPTLPGVRAKAPEMPAALWSKPFRPTSTTLFRYSALTFNGHRIHYDVDYCRQIEGYSDLVIHGPLNATLMAGFAQEVSGKCLKTFRYRGLQPSLLGSDLTINAAKDGDGLQLWIGLPDGAVSMRADATF